MTEKLQWVSEWRVEPSSEIDHKFGYHYKATNGGVYSSTATREESQKIVDDRIPHEMRMYMLNRLSCPYCGEDFTHGHRFCLQNLAIRRENEI